MRQLFVYLFEPAEPFSFGDFLQRKLEDDLGQLLGIDWSLWIVMVLLLLVNGPLGFAVFTIQLGALLVSCIIGTILVRVIATSMKAVQTALEAGEDPRSYIRSNSYFMNNSSRILIPVRIIMFFTSVQVRATLHRTPKPAGQGKAVHCIARALLSGARRKGNGIQGR